jgi:hypothetical protein
MSKTHDVGGCNRGDDIIFGGWIRGERLKQPDICVYYDFSCCKNQQIQCFQWFNPYMDNHVATHRTFAMSSGHLITIRREIRWYLKNGPNDRFYRLKCTLMSRRTRHRIGAGHARLTYRLGVLSRCPVPFGRLLRAPGRQNNRLVILLGYDTPAKAAIATQLAPVRPGG